MLVYDFFYQLFHYIYSIDFYDFRWLTCNIDKPVAYGKIYDHERKKEIIRNMHYTVHYTGLGS